MLFISSMACSDFCSSPEAVAEAAAAGCAASTGILGMVRAPPYARTPDDEAGWGLGVGAAAAGVLEAPDEAMGEA